MIEGTELRVSTQVLILQQSSRKSTIVVAIATASHRVSRNPVEKRRPWSDARVREGVGG